MQIYLARNQVQAGPYTLDQLNKMLATNQVSLDDLMWHEGMNEWKKVGELTNGTHHYMPNGKPAQSRPTVEQLTGNNNASAGKATKLKPNLVKSVALKKQAITKVGNNELASVGNRVLAVLIDNLLMVLCFIPFLSAIDFDIEKLRESLQDPTAFESLATTIPTHLAAMTLLMAIALLAIQLVMLLKRGQTIGKLAVGVRILDVTTHRIPAAFNLIVVRSILTNLVYKIPVIGIIIMFADFAFMVLDKRNISLHDKAAKTYVVKAHDSQLNKPK